MISISIVIATYNSAKTLKQTLDSIRYQTYKNLEVIIIDGLSNDGTMNIVREYSDVVSKCISEHDTGIYQAFNKGIDLATGDYICFIGSDDCYCNYDAFDNIVKKMHGYEDVYSFGVIGVNSNTFIENHYKVKYTNEDVFLGNMIPHPGLLVKTYIMKKYRFNESNKIISDYEFLLRYIMDGGKIKFYDIPLVYFSEEGISSSKIGSKNWIIRLTEHVCLLNRLGLQKYTQNHIDLLFPTIKLNSISYHLKCINKIIRRKLGMGDNYKKYLKFWKRHSCNLRICRWCGRN